ncbi:MAG: flavin reductase family protein [Acidobacteriota bacterium]
MDDKAFRNLMGQFATGVTVVTTNVDGDLHGMTANAVTSVSLDPLLLLVCVVRGNNCHQQLQKSSHFAVNILSAEQEDVSNTFARSGDPEAGELRGADYQLGAEGSPILAGTLGWVECRKSEVLAGGDHDIFVGEALSGEILGGDPLLFWGGGYRRIASVD